MNVARPQRLLMERLTHLTAEAAAVHRHVERCELSEVSGQPPADMGHASAAAQQPSTAQGSRARSSANEPEGARGAHVQAPAHSRRQDTHLSRKLRGRISALGRGDASTHREATVEMSGGNQIKLDEPGPA